MRMNRWLKYLFDILVMYLVFAVCDTPGMKKYVIIGLLMSFYFIMGRKKQWSAEIFIIISLPIVTYLVLGIVTTFLNASEYMTTVKIVVFWLIPLLFALALYVAYGKKMPYIVDVQFVCSCLVYLITKGRFILETIHVESMFAYVYGAFFIYYAYKKRWWFCLIAAPLMYLTDKRIVVLAVLAAIFVQLFLWIFRNDKRIAIGVWSVSGIAINLYLWLIYSGTLETFCKGVGINTNGRVKMYGAVMEWFADPFFTAGNGLGIVEMLLDAWNIEKFSNLHNDLLKFYLELGFAGLILLLISYGVMFWWVEKKYGKAQMKLFLSMTIYTMILFATDNVSIYIIYLSPVYSIYFAELSGSDKKEIIKIT